MEKTAQKERLRKEILGKRILLSPEEINEYSSVIFKKLKKTEYYLQSKNIMFYVATKSEVQTKNMIEKSINIGKNISIPVMDCKSGNLHPSLLIDFNNELEKNNQGIFEPKGEFKRFFPEAKLDLIIVPGVAFDIMGNRLGRGKGYYDHFLKAIASSILKIALAYEIQIVEKIPTDTNDVPVDMIITEKRFIECI